MAYFDEFSYKMDDPKRIHVNHVAVEDQVKDEPFSGEVKEEPKQPCAFGNSWCVLGMQLHTRRECTLTEPGTTFASGSRVVDPPGVHTFESVEDKEHPRR